LIGSLAADISKKIKDSCGKNGKEEDEIEDK